MVANTLAVVDEFDEPVIVIFRHRDVDVVVPGDEALMAGSAEQGAVYEPIAKAVFFMKTKLPALRKMHKITQAELAAAMGVSRQTISSIETGQFNPTAKLALVLCIALDKKFEDLFYFD